MSNKLGVMDAKRVMAFLREERQRKCKTQLELAEEAGVGANTVWRMESAGTCDLGTFLKIVGCMWDDLAAFGEDYTYWEESHGVKRIL